MKWFHGRESGCDTKDDQDANEDTCAALKWLRTETEFFSEMGRLGVNIKTCSSWCLLRVVAKRSTSRGRKEEQRKQIEFLNILAPRHTRTHTETKRKEEEFLCRQIVWQSGVHSKNCNRKVRRSFFTFVEYKFLIDWRRFNDGGGQGERVGIDVVKWSGDGRGRELEMWWQWV